MSIYFILSAMIFLHIIDDYCLQAPCLCDLKQKSFWEKNAPQKLYKNDYLCALLMHSLSWLAPNGTAAIVTFPGIMYRSGAEQKIRKYLKISWFLIIKIEKEAINKS